MTDQDIKTCKYCGNSEADGTKFRSESKYKCGKCIDLHHREYLKNNPEIYKKKNESSRTRYKRKMEIKNKNKPAKIILTDEEKKIKQYENKRKYTRRLNARYNNLIQTSRRRRVYFNITLEEFSKFANAPCHYCNNILGKISDGGSNIDRIDNSKGYIERKYSSLLCCV